MTGDALSRLLGEIGADTRDHVKAKIAEAIEPLQKRLAELEARPHGLKFVGPWTAGTPYAPGDCTSRKGLWCCMEPTTDQPGTSPAWRLMLRDGRDGRDGKDPR